MIRFHGRVNSTYGITPVLENQSRSTKKKQEQQKKNSWQLVAILKEQAFSVVKVLCLSFFSENWLKD